MTACYGMHYVWGPVIGLNVESEGKLMARNMRDKTREGTMRVNYLIKKSLPA
ncbi:hypothetical protein M413DRAFT_438014 [Hebeloma cylindrosporum]|uniref:Uncharacterized protein n=1 Tax=Hebeloma cylindrosporum TaxID=76867 RepID=A0A0C2YGJ8_HEBCY|nr:hypothetical protein M413DRAFT_438014 [Hebeloma cylindrosporum h7]